MRPSFNDLPFIIAEDSEDDLILFQRALRKAGVRNPQIAAATGQETVHYLERASQSGGEFPFPVILFLDLLMPESDGFAVLRWLRDHPHPPISIVLHTGVEDETLLQRARDLGASFYLPKGVRPEAIHEVFRRARAEWEQYQLVHT